MLLLLLFVFLFFYFYSLDLYHDLINKSNITIFNYYNPNLCIKKEKVPFTINISYSSCSHPVKLTQSPSSDIGIYIYIYFRYYILFYKILKNYFTLS